MPKISVVTPKSGNAKIGDAAATYAPRETCPDACPLRDSGQCYGNGFRTRRVWDSISGVLSGAVSRAAASILAALSEAEGIDAIRKPSRDMRVHVLGDASTDSAARILSAACARYVARAVRPVRVWSYSHAWRTVSRASWGAVSVLASCESADDIKAATAAGWATARVVDAFPDGARVFVRDGIRHLPCAEQAGTAASCIDCGWCMRDGWLRDRGLTVAFAAHGQKAREMRATYAV